MDLRKKKQILVMPTFRIYVDREHFDDSEYFKAYKQLLCSEILHQHLERTGYTLIFYPHYEFQSKIDSFKNLNLSDRISIADMSYDVQQLLKESEILITDYSSVFFDVMYMNKPVLFISLMKRNIELVTTRKAIWIIIMLDLFLPLLMTYYTI